MAMKEYYWVDAPVWREPSNIHVPSWWRNMIFNCTAVQVRERGIEYMDYERQNEIISSELKPFGGECVQVDYKTKLRFDDESGFTFFLLKWA
jgi:hypothetical protein